MNTTISKTLAAVAILALPFAGAAIAGQTANGTHRIAQGTGQIPAECVGITNPEERAACIREFSGK